MFFLRYLILSFLHFFQKRGGNYVNKAPFESFIKASYIERVLFMIVSGTLVVFVVTQKGVPFFTGMGMFRACSWNNGL